MSLAELKSFNAVAQHGGFVKASQEISRSQPTVSAQVRNLEKRYGVDLFFRGRGQTAKLTPLGTQLYETTKQLFNLERDAHNLMQNSGKAQGGYLRLGAISPRWALPVMTQLATDLPSLELSLVIDNSQALLKATLNHDLDVCFIGLHEKNTRSFAEKISQPEIVLIASAEHPNAKSGIINRAEFSKQTLLQREEGSETRALIEENFHHHEYKPARTLEIGGRESVLMAAQKGLGIAPFSLDEINPSQPAQILRCADFTTYGEVHMLCLKNRSHLPIIKAVFEIESKAATS